MRRMIIREMQSSDIPIILEIEKESFSSPWNEEAFQNELSNPMTHYYVWEENGQAVGYIGFWKVFEEAHITNIAFALSERGQGKGTRLIAHVMEQAKSMGILAMTLEVRESNEIARKVYQKNGFREVGIRKDYYTKPLENALIMWVDI